ncbi:MAG: hypothetical protein JWM80_1794 [Cyanobacteria bacterium RYN_339]|nr:hypothetical protein [Cyanobacteria bacterium RYN_339]
MNSRLITSAIACALVMAGCNASPMGTPMKGATSAEEQAFLAANGMTPRYQRMLTQVDASVDASAGATLDGTSTTVDAGATATVDAGGTTVTTTTGAGVSVTDPLVSSGMAAHAALSQLTTANVGCSSNRSDWFKLDFLTDGNLHSAWGAAADDANPTLTFDLKNCTTLHGLGIKQSGGVKFDVAVQVGAGAWTVIGTDLTSEAAKLDWVELKASAATKVQLRFHGENVGKLLVCEVKWFGDACATTPSTQPSTTPSTAPSTLPSTTPSTTPSQTPMPTPTPVPSTGPSTQPSTMPSDHCGCKVTGGGFLRLGVGKGNHKVTFGFVAMEKNGQVKGNLELNDHLTKTKFHAKITTLTCDEHTATFGGTLEGSSVTWSATVTANQQISVTVGGHVICSGILAGGKIKFHIDHDCTSSDDDDVKLCQRELEEVKVHCDAHLKCDLRDLDNED